MRFLRAFWRLSDAAGRTELAERSLRPPFRNARTKLLPIDGSPYHQRPMCLYCDFCSAFGFHFVFIRNSVSDLFASSSTETSSVVVLPREPSVWPQLGVAAHKRQPLVLLRMVRVNRRPSDKSPITKAVVVQRDLAVTPAAQRRGH